MDRGIPIGRIGAVPLYLRPAWFVVAVLITVFYAPTVRLQVPVAGGLEYVVAFGFALLLLASVLVHELAHAATAAAAGTPATHIVLDLWGGHTTFAQEAPDPWRSVAVSVAGPLSNVALALLAEVAATGTTPGGVGRLLLLATATANLVVAAFNSLPGLPLDGGRVLEALVWRVTDDRYRGTVVAGWSGRVLASALVAWTLLAVWSGRGLVGPLWLLLIAWLLWRGAGQGIGAAQWNRRADRARVDDLLRPAVSVPSTASVATARAAAADAGADQVVVLDVYGRPASIVDERSAAGVPPGRAGLVGVVAVAHALPPGGVLAAGLGGDALLDRLREAPTERYAVVDAVGQVVGVLDWDDVARFVSP